MTSALVAQVVHHLESMPLNLQEQVLAFVQALDSVIRRGVAGQQLLQFADSIDKADLQLMSQAIEEGCEQVELNVTQSLGVVDTVRFSQQSDLDLGDYTKDRSQWLGNPSLNDIATEIKAQKNMWPQHK